MNATKTRGRSKTSAPPVENGKFTLGQKDCDMCSRSTLVPFGYQIKVMCGTYSYDGKQICRTCAKKLWII